MPRLALLLGILCACLSARAQGTVSLSQSSVDFGAESMGATSFARTLTLTNSGSGTLTISGVGISDPQFSQTNDCSTLAPGATCSVAITFTPSPAPGAVNSAVPVSATLSIVSDAASSPDTASLSGTGEKSLVTHFYEAVLRREPDAGGKSFWQLEAIRLSELEANVNETWYAMAMYFFFSPEYASLGRDDAGFVTDLYNTFFNRPPDASGLSFWTGQIASGMPREIVLASFMFSPEFASFTQGIFGNTAARAEADTAMDFYRGALARLPDDGGFSAYAEQLRATQCAGDSASALMQDAAAISVAFFDGPEYAGRSRSNAQYVGDLYNAVLRRGGDPQGVQFWIGQLDGGALTRDQVRLQFLASPEFAARIDRLVADGCIARGVVTDISNSVSVSFPMIAVGNDGLPAVTYEAGGGPNAGAGLFIARCGGADCSGGNNSSSLLDGISMFLPAPVGFAADGLPIVASYQSQLKVYKCGSSQCTFLASTANYAESSSGNYWISFVDARAPGGMALVAYWVAPPSGGSASVVVRRCLDDACTSSSRATVFGTTIAMPMSAAIPGDGLPVVAVGSSLGLQLVKCGTADCSSGNVTSTLDPVPVYSVAAATAPNGLAYIAYTSLVGSNRVVKLLACGDVACASGNSIALVDPVGGGDTISLAIGSDGLPVVAYNDAPQSSLSAMTVKVAKCGDAQCASGNSVVTLAGAGAPLQSPSVAMGSSGLPILVVLGKNASKADVVRTIACARPGCN